MLFGRQTSKGFAHQTELGLHSEPRMRASELAQAHRVPRATCTGPVLVGNVTQYQKKESTRKGSTSTMISVLSYDLLTFSLNLVNIYMHECRI